MKSPKPKITHGPWWLTENYLAVVKVTDEEAKAAGLEEHLWRHTYMIVDVPKNDVIFHVGQLIAYPDFSNRVDIYWAAQVEVLVVKKEGVVGVWSPP